jgi:hypothetical protein
MTPSDELIEAVLWLLSRERSLVFADIRAAIRRQGGSRTRRVLAWVRLGPLILEARRLARRRRGQIPPSLFQLAHSARYWTRDGDDLVLRSMVRAVSASSVPHLLAELFPDERTALAEGPPFVQMATPDIAAMLSDIDVRDRRADARVRLVDALLSTHAGQLTDEHVHMLAARGSAVSLLAECALGPEGRGVIRPAVERLRFQHRVAAAQAAAGRSFSPSDLRAGAVDSDELADALARVIARMDGSVDEAIEALSGVRSGDSWTNLLAPLMQHGRLRDLVVLDGTFQRATGIALRILLAGGCWPWPTGVTRIDRAFLVELLALGASDRGGSLHDAALQRLCTKPVVSAAVVGAAPLDTWEESQFVAFVAVAEQSLDLVARFDAQVELASSVLMLDPEVRPGPDTRDRMRVIIAARYATEDAICGARGQPGVAVGDLRRQCGVDDR